MTNKAKVDINTAVWVHYMDADKSYCSVTGYVCVCVCVCVCVNILKAMIPHSLLCQITTILS